MNVFEVEIKIGHRGQTNFTYDFDVLDDCGAEKTDQFPLTVVAKGSEP
jgi:hypothetical protein